MTSVWGGRLVVERPAGVCNRPADSSGLSLSPGKLPGGGQVDKAEFCTELPSFRAEAVEAFWGLKFCNTFIHRVSCFWFHGIDPMLIKLE